jgi:acetylornithine deacetylase
MRGEALDWLQTLVAVDSESPREAAAQEVVAQVARSVGLHAELIAADPAGELEQDERFVTTGMTFSSRPNCVVTLPGAQGRPLVCNAHIDTVAVGDGWTRNPSGEWDGDRFYGLGACDTKASTVASLLAAACLLHLGEPPSSPIELHSVIDEEPGGNGTLAMLRSRAADAPLPRLAVVMEPSRLDLFTGHRGMLWYGLRCVGVQAHGSTSNGVNAIEKAAGVVLALRSLNEELDRWDLSEYPRPRLNTGVIRGGHEVYTTPGSCRIDVSARYGPDQREAVDAALQAAFVASTLPGEVEQLFCMDFDASETPEDDPTVVAALAALRSHRPQAQVSRLTGTCDMRHYRNMLGVPSVIFGPGDLGVAHAPDEYVDVDEIFVAARVLVDLALTSF